MYGEEVGLPLVRSAGGVEGPIQRSFDNADAVGGVLVLVSHQHRVVVDVISTRRESRPRRQRLAEVNSRHLDLRTAVLPVEPVRTPNGSRLSGVG